MHTWDNQLVVKLGSASDKELRCAVETGFLAFAEMLRWLSCLRLRRRQRNGSNLGGTIIQEHPR